MDFTITAELAADAKRVKDFVAEEIIPLESDTSHFDPFGNIKSNLLFAL